VEKRRSKAECWKLKAQSSKLKAQSKTVISNLFFKSKPSGKKIAFISYSAWVEKGGISNFMKPVETDRPACRR
jgi:hypothetical protein